MILKCPETRELSQLQMVITQSILNLFERFLSLDSISRADLKFSSINLDQKLTPKNIIQKVRTKDRVSQTPVQDGLTE